MCVVFIVLMNKIINYDNYNSIKLVSIELNLFCQSTLREEGSPNFYLFFTQYWYLCLDKVTSVVRTLYVQVKELTSNLFRIPSIHKYLMVSYNCKL